MLSCSRSVHQGRQAVIATLDGLEERKIVSAVVDGVASGHRGVLTVTCTFPHGA